MTLQNHDIPLNWPNRKVCAITAGFRIVRHTMDEYPGARMIDLAIERPHGRPLMLRVAEEFVPGLLAALSSQPVPSPELGTTMPPAVPSTLYAVSLPYASHDAEGAYLTRDAAMDAARAAIREMTTSVISEVHDVDDDRSSLVAGPVIVRVDPMRVHDASLVPGLPVDVMHATADGPGIQTHYRYGEDDHSDAEPAEDHGGEL